MSRIPEEHAEAHIDFSLRYFFNQVYHSIKCLRIGNQAAYRFEVAEGIKPFLQAVFCLHERRPLAFYKYLAWELEHHPLEKLSLSSGELLDDIQSILDTGDYRVQQRLVREVEHLAHAEGFNSAVDEWKGGLEWIKGFQHEEEPLS